MMGTITRDTLNRVMDLRDDARDEYDRADFGRLVFVHIGIDLSRAGWSLIPDTPDALRRHIETHEVTAAQAGVSLHGGIIIPADPATARAVIQQIAPSLGLRVCDAVPSVEAAQ